MTMQENTKIWIKMNWGYESW